MPLYAIHTSDDVYYIEAFNIGYAIRCFTLEDDDTHEDLARTEDEIEAIVVISFNEVIR